MAPLGRGATFDRMSRALLLAEAEPGTRDFLERHLASEGFEVLGAEAQDLALELVERARPDLVLVGELEDASAPEVCRRLREGEPGRSWDRNVPVIVLGIRLSVRQNCIPRNATSAPRARHSSAALRQASLISGGAGCHGGGPWLVKSPIDSGLALSTPTPCRSATGSNSASNRVFCSV